MFSIKIIFGDRKYQDLIEELINLGAWLSGTNTIGSGVDEKGIKLPNKIHFIYDRKKQTVKWTKK